MKSVGVSQTSSSGNEQLGFYRSFELQSNINHGSSKQLSLDNRSQKTQKPKPVPTFSKTAKMISSGKSPAQKLMRAHILLSVDVSEGSVNSDKDIAKSLKTSPSNVERARIRFVEESLDIALNGVERKPKEPVKIDGKVQAYIAMLACTTPPEQDFCERYESLDFY